MAGESWPPKPTAGAVPARKSVYLIGSLRNPKIPELAQHLRSKGLDVFDDWHSVGPEADDHWRDYEKHRGHSFKEALKGYPARHAFEFDRHHLQRCDAAVMVMPAGKSGHLELGYAAGLGKQTIIFMDGEAERWDLMYCFADAVVNFREELDEALGVFEVAGAPPFEVTAKGADFEYLPHRAVFPAQEAGCWCGQAHTAQEANFYNDALARRGG